MLRADVVALSRIEADPAVSILAPIDRREPTRHGARVRFEQLIDEACLRVRAVYPEERAHAVVDRLCAVRQELAIPPGSAGLALFASAEASQVVALPFPVDEQVSVDSAFATRQVLAGLGRTSRVLVLVLSRRRARVLEGDPDHLVEIDGAGFPLEVDPPHEWDTPHRDRPLHEGIATEAHRFVYRAVDRALDGLGLTERSAIVLVGVARELATFAQVSRHGRLVIGQVHGNYVGAGPSEIARVVGPVVDAWRDARQDAAVGEVLDGVGTGRALTDPVAVLDAARTGRGHRLVIEAGYSGARDGTGGLGSRRDGGSVGDDAVRFVLAAGGEVVVVTPGKLAPVGGLGLVLRY